jgi:predicted ATPase
MMPISRIDLTNVLAFRELRLKMTALTVLTGTNSAGKSSILHALAMLRQSSIAQMLPEALLLNGGLVELGTGRDLLHADPGPIVNLEDVGLRVALEANGTAGEWIAGYEAAADVLPLESAPPAGEPSGGLFEPGFQYLKADRIVPAVTFPKSHEAVSVLRTLGPRGEHAANYLRVHGDSAIACPNAGHPSAAGSSLLDQTNAWLEVLSAGTSVGVADVDGADLVRLTFRRKTEDVPTAEQRATNVGFGLTYALPVVLACLSASPGTLILLENPEAHLHPHGQAAVGRLCALAAASGAQLVLETHSDHVLNAIRLAVKHKDLRASDVIFHFFSRRADRLEPGLDSLLVSDDGMLPAWPSGFFDEWDKALDELLG